MDRGGKAKEGSEEWRLGETVKKAPGALINTNDIVSWYVLNFNLIVKHVTVNKHVHVLQTSSEWVLGCDVEL